MEEWGVALILIGISIVVAAAMVGMCRMLGGWTYLYAWATGNKEERAQLASYEEFSVNGYVAYPPPSYPRGEQVRPPYLTQQTFSGSLKAVEGGGSNIPTHAVPAIPPPPANEHASRRFSLDIARRSSIDVELPDVLAMDGSGSSTKLQRAMSCDSVCSDTSVVLDTLESPQHSGELEISLEYSRKSKELIVTVIGARGLASFDSTTNNVDSYIRVCVLPDQSTNMQTEIQRGTKEPTYNERFQFVAPAETLAQRVLKCMAYTCDKFSNTLMGEAELRVGDIDLKEPYTAWLPLIDTQRRQVGSGELLFSLSYLPTAERLTVVLVKARNLVWTDNKENADPFVKIYLLQKGKKISKKKTSVKRGDKNPTFNEAMIFSVPSAALQNIQLRLTMAEHQMEGKAPAVGHVFVGPHCSGKQLSHWNQMISSPRKPTAMWHPLKKRDG